MSIELELITYEIIKNGAVIGVIISEATEEVISELFDELRGKTDVESVDKVVDQLNQEGYKTSKSCIKGINI